MAEAAEKMTEDNNVDLSTAGDFLTVFIDDQIFAIPVLQTQDVLSEQQLYPVPMAPPAIAGSLNLRGRIITAIDVRVRLGLKPTENIQKQTSVVIEHGNELFSLFFDRVGDVMTMYNKNFENTPATLDSVWKDVASGVYRLDEGLLIVLDVPKLLDLSGL